MLLELASVVRKSAVSLRDYFLPSNFLGSDDAYFEDLAKLLVRNRFPNARRSLTDQLGHSIFTRRRRLLYHQRHEEKLSYPRPGPDGQQREQVLPLSNSVLTDPRIMPHDTRLRPEQDYRTIPAPSETTLSKIDRNALRKRVKAPTTISGRVKGSIVREEAQFDYPKPPTPVDDKYCICPYCFKPLLATEVKSDFWKKHVDRDLQPLVCMSEKCKDRVHFFVNQDEWLQHMRAFHGEDWPQRIHMTTWFCDLGHSAPLEFTNETSFREHLSIEHESIDKPRGNALLRRNRGLGCREQTICPLCERTPADVLFKLRDSDKLILLYQHISEHLKALAFFSLPTLRDDLSDDGQHTSSGGQFMLAENESRSSGHSRGLSSGEDDTGAISVISDDDGPHHSEKLVIDSDKFLQDDFPLTDGTIDVEEIDWTSYLGSHELEDRPFDPVLDKFEAQYRRKADSDPNVASNEGLSKGDPVAGESSAP